MFQCYDHDRHPGSAFALLGDSTLHTDASGTAPPDAFGPFRVLHQIGVGVLGPVYRAYQPDPGRLVAVKLFRTDLQPDLAVRFVASLERLIASDLTHMGIAAPLATGVVDGAPYLALDFVAAESFDVVVRDYGPAPAAEALRIATQLGGALDFAAAVNVLHGSLHPRDVLVSTDDTRVTGLGIGQALEAVGITPPVRRPYTAPERIAGQPWDRRADVFSLAALVTEMLCGRRLAGTGAVAAEGLPEIDGANMDELRSVIGRALAEEPGDRYETALGFVEGLHGAFVRPSARPTPPRRRKRDADPLRPARSVPTPQRVTPPELPLMLGSDADPENGPGKAEWDTPVEMTEPLVTEEPSIASAPARDAVVPLEGDAPVLSPHMPEPADVPETGHAIDPQIDVRVDDLALRQAEDERYSTVESAPAIPEVPIAPEINPPVRTESPSAVAVEATQREVVDVETRPSMDDGPAIRPAVATANIARISEDRPLEPDTRTSVALAERRSGVWPILLALIVGMMVGSALGFAVGSRDRGEASTQAQVQIPSSEPRSVPPAPTVAQPAQPVPSAGARTPAPSSSQAYPPRGTATGSGQTARAPERAAAPDTRDRERPRSTAPERSPTDIGRLLVRSSPSGASVSLDGRPAGTTPLTLRDVAVGTHVLRVTHQGYTAAEQRVRISAAQPAQSIEVALAAARAERQAPAAPGPAERTSGLPAAAPGAKEGSLIVDSRPSGARVLVDGKLVGTTPFLLDDVAAGDHTVRLELDGFAPWSTSAHVAGGERTRVSGSLEQR